jgi:RNA polymerase primary sigma factor
MPHNLATLDHLMSESRVEFRKLISTQTTAEDVRDARVRFRRLRGKSLHLVEELSLRTRRVQPLVKILRGMSSRMDRLQADLRAVAYQPTGPLRDAIGSSLTRSLAWVDETVVRPWRLRSPGLVVIGTHATSSVPWGLLPTV